MGVEYRVRWQREGRKQTTRIYQSGEAAYRKVQGVLALDAVKAETSLATMPDLVGPPVVETRQVGDWAEAAFQIREPDEYTKRKVADWAEWARPSAVTPIGDPDVPF